ncbi:MAG: leucine-rich repeat protein, partial [Clostridia bacterium]|nr:leucine-rich repeat protein [Clostridia bacterium]
MKKLLSSILTAIMLISSVSVSSFISFAEETIEEEAVIADLPQAAEETVNDEEIIAKEPDVFEEVPAFSADDGRESDTVTGDIATASGKCGDNLTWEIDTLGVLTVSGTGDMYDYEYDVYTTNNTPWNSYNSKVKSVVINEGVTSIGSDAFCLFRNLTNIEISNTVTSIGYYAFYDCESLTSVVVPGNVKTIGKGAFSYNDMLSNVSIQDGVEIIDERAFFRTGLKKITFPDSVTKIRKEAFYETRLTNVTFGSGLTYIGVDAFYNYDISRVDIPSIEAWCNIVFGNENANPVYRCNLYINGKVVNDIVIPEGVKKINSFAFNYHSYLRSVTIPSSVEEIGGKAFYNCYSLINITISDGVKNIGIQAFYNTRITNLVIPDSVTYIGYYAVGCCTKLTSITLPFIGRQPYATADSKQYPLGYIFSWTSHTDSVSALQYLEEYKDYNSIDTFYLPSTLKTVVITGGDIPYGAFSNCSKIENIVLPDNTEDIPPYTFYGCTSLKQVSVPNSVSSIGEYAFYQCINLTSIDIPDNIASIEVYTFAGCAALKNIQMPDKVISIGDYSFSECLELTTLNIPMGVKYIGENAFRQCTKFKDISLPYSVSYIGSYAFNNTGYYNDSANWNGDVLYIGNNLVANKTTLSGHCDILPLTRCIAGSAFRDCELLTSVSIPNSVVYIGTNAFYLSGIYNYPDNWENGVLYIGDCLIATDSSVTGEYIIKDGTRLIKDTAFSNRSELNYITIPKTVKYIGADAFIRCTNLTIRCAEGSAAEAYALANSIPVSYLHTKCVFTNYISNNDGNCYEDGTMTAYCDLGCGKTDTITEPDSKIHDYYRDIARAATCQREGLCVNICRICRYYYTEVIDKVDHKFSNYIYNDDATCYADGTKTAVCYYGCGATDTIPEEGSAAHSYSNYVYNEDATCLKNGTKTAYCDFGCGNSKTITASNTRLPHDYKKEIIEAPTCISEGMMICICRSCLNYTYEDVPVSSEHSGEWVITVEPTVNSEGEKTRVCTLCGVTETQAVAKIEIPVIDVNNYIVSITSADYIKYIRYAYGEYSSSAEIKNAPGCVTLNQRNVLEHTGEGIAKLEMEKGGCYSFWIKLTDGSEYVYLADLSVMKQSIHVDANRVTVCDLYGVKDFFIAYGEQNSYRAVKDNLLVQVTSKKIGESHNYSYMINQSGVYTLCVRYDDSTREYSFITFEVVLPEVIFTENGSQLNISGIDGVKVIRFAYGEYNSAGEIKRAENSVSYSGKGRLQGVNEYTLNLTSQGPVSVSV